MMGNLQKFQKLAVEHKETKLSLLNKQASMNLSCNPYFRTSNSLSGNIFLPFALVVHPRGNADYLVEYIPKVRPKVEKVMRDLHLNISSGLDNFSAEYRIYDGTQYDVRGDSRILIKVDVNYGMFHVSELKDKFPTYHEFYRVFENILNKNNTYVNKFEGSLLKW
jgi:hypothetical protein